MNWQLNEAVTVKQTLKLNKETIADDGARFTEFGKIFLGSLATSDIDIETSIKTNNKSKSIAIASIDTTISFHLLLDASDLKDWRFTMDMLHQGYLKAISFSIS